MEQSPANRQQRPRLIYPSEFCTPSPIKFSPPKLTPSVDTSYYTSYVDSDSDTSHTLPRIREQHDVFLMTRHTAPKTSDDSPSNTDASINEEDLCGKADVSLEPPLPQAPLSVASGNTQTTHPTTLPCPICFKTLMRKGYQPLPYGVTSIAISLSMCSHPKNS